MQENHSQKKRGRKRRRRMHVAEIAAYSAAFRSRNTMPERVTTSASAIKKILPEEIVKQEDPNSFMIITSATEVFGEGYKSYFSHNA